MSDTYTETSTKSWGDRLWEAFKGVLVGFLLIAGASYLLWWNEGRTVRQRDAIAEAQKITVEMPDVKKVDPEFNGKMVHAFGHADTKDIVRDDVFGVKVNAIALEREVEFYQWTETSETHEEKKLGGGTETKTTYTYDRKWVGSPVNSSDFKRVSGHENSNKLPNSVDDEYFYAKKVMFGAYRFPPFLVKSVEGARPLTVKLDHDRLAGLESYYSGQNNGQSAASVLGGGNRKMVHVSGNMIYIGANPSSPQIGDARIAYKEVPPADVSIIAKVSGDTFDQFTAKNGNKFFRLEMGDISAQTMFQDANDDNQFMAWLLRAAGIALVCIGFYLILSPISVLADVVPLVGSVAGFGIMIVSGLAGFAWAFTIIALAWLRFHPIFSCVMLGIAAVFVTLIFIRKKNAPAPVA